jgi:hypothetical protein
VLRAAEISVAKFPLVRGQRLRRGAGPGSSIHLAEGGGMRGGSLYIDVDMSYALCAG